MSGKDKIIEKYSNGLQCTVCYSEDCQEAIVVVSPLELTEKQSQSRIVDSQNSTFSARKIQKTAETYYYQYEIILTSIDKNYWIEINGEKVRPFE